MGVLGPATEPGGCVASPCCTDMQPVSDSRCLGGPPWLSDPHTAVTHELKQPPCSPPSVSISLFLSPHLSLSLTHSCPRSVTSLTSCMNESHSPSPERVQCAVRPARHCVQGGGADGKVVTSSRVPHGGSCCGGGWRSVCLCLCGTRELRPHV